MKQYIVDAFTDKVFSGNQAAVCIMNSWISKELMLNIAKENNYSETAFAVKEGEHYHLRWFTPGGEVELCGHATLATAYVIMRFYERELTAVTFETLSGILTVDKKDELYEMDFPAYEWENVPITDEMEEALGVRPVEACLSRELLVVLDSQEAVWNFIPDMEKLKRLDGIAVAVTARGTEYDCVSRVFAPKLSIPEDPVTGSTHCFIVPYWAKKLGKNKLTAYQASERRGVLYAECVGERIKIAGEAALYSVSDILPESDYDING